MGMQRSSNAERRRGASESANQHVAVTEQIIAQLDAGCAPWVRPWSGSQLPANAFTHRPYRGANIVALWMTQTIGGYPTAAWVSFRQALQLGGNVRKGEHGTPIFFYSLLERDDERAKDGVRRIPLLRSYTVFNVAQCDGLPGCGRQRSATEFRATRRRGGVSARDRRDGTARRQSSVLLTDGRHNHAAAVRAVRDARALLRDVAA